MNNKSICQALAQTFGAYLNCLESNNTEWQAKHKNKIEEICENHLPSGSGIDCGTKFDFDSSKINKLVFIVEFHHMNEGGFYDGWTTHFIKITPNLQHEFEISISGSNKNDIKDYLAETYQHALSEEFVEKP